MRAPVSCSHIHQPLSNAWLENELAAILPASLHPLGFYADGSCSPNVQLPDGSKKNQRLHRIDQWLVNYLANELEKAFK